MHSLHNSHGGHTRHSKRKDKNNSNTKKKQNCHTSLLFKIQYATTTQRNITQQAALTTIPVAIQIS